LIIPNLTDLATTDIPISLASVIRPPVAIEPQQLIIDGRELRLAVGGTQAELIF
jgi:hypothetical protein